MISDFLAQQIRGNFPHLPTPEQEKALTCFADFLVTPAQRHKAFVLRGYAGTGKTSLVAALVKTLDKLEQKVVLLAPTGRAAKVFAAYAGHPAFTIHKKIYRQRNFSNALDNFSLNENLATHTLFIVDEASMIANEGLSGSMFGTGRLLDDLVHYVYSGKECRLLLVGDTAQLPPVGELLSPALDTLTLEGYGLQVSEADLTQVVRQVQDSGILWNATQLRHLVENGSSGVWPKVRLKGFADVRVLPGAELTDELSACYGRDGMDETIVICRSNKRANLYNNGIRAQVLWCEDELNTGDLLMVAKNNYYWAAQVKEMDFVANGEIVMVKRIRRTRELYGFRFAEVTLLFPEQGDVELDVNILLDTLHTDAPALPKAENDRLFYAVLEDYADLTRKAERMRKMKTDPYYNALQVKYAYAITCHKAQGGQWKNVFLDQGYLSADYLTPEYYRWLYTAFTRATHTLYLVNFPEAQVDPA